MVDRGFFDWKHFIKNLSIVYFQFINLNILKANKNKSVTLRFPW